MASTDALVLVKPKANEVLHCEDGSISQGFGMLSPELQDHVDGVLELIRKSISSKLDSWEPIRYFIPLIYIFTYTKSNCAFTSIYRSQKQRLMLETSLVSSGSAPTPLVVALRQFGEMFWKHLKKELHSLHDRTICEVTAICNDNISRPPLQSIHEDGCSNKSYNFLIALEDWYRVGFLDVTKKRRGLALLKKYEYVRFLRVPHQGTLYFVIIFILH